MPVNMPQAPQNLSGPQFQGGISAQAGPPMQSQSFRPQMMSRGPAGLGGSMAFAGARPMGRYNPGMGMGQQFQGGGAGGQIFRGINQAFRPGGMPTRMDTPATMNPALQGGVRPGANMMGGPSVGSPQGPSLEQIQAEMARRNVGAQLGPRNGALAGYMMG